MHAELCTVTLAQKMRSKNAKRVLKGIDIMTVLLVSHIKTVLSLPEPWYFDGAFLPQMPDAMQLYV